MADARLSAGVPEQEEVGGLGGEGPYAHHDLCCQSAGHAHRLFGEVGHISPATAQVAKRLAWGDVLGVGNNVRMVKVGDRVLFNPDDQLEVEIQGDMYLVMRERDIHALATERTEHGTGLYL